MCKRGNAGDGQCWVQSTAAQKLEGEREPVAGESAGQMCEHEGRRGGCGIQLHIPIILLFWSFGCRDAKVEGNRRRARNSGCCGGGEQGIMGLQN